MLDPDDLPPRQREVFDLIQNSEGYLRLQDIADELGISKSTTGKHIEVLTEKGYVRRKANGRLAVVTSIELFQDW